MEGPPFGPAGIFPGPDAFQNDDAVFFDAVGNFALHIEETLLNERSLDLFRLFGGQRKLFELVGIRSGTGPDADHLADQVHAGDGDHTLARFHHGVERVIP